MRELMKKKIKVLHVMYGMDRGGAEAFLMNILRTYDREKFEMVVCCYGKYREGKTGWDYQPELRKLGIKIIKITDIKFGMAPRFIADVWKFVKNLKKLIVSSDIDIVHSHIDATSALPMVAAKMAGRKIRIAHSHSAGSPHRQNLLHYLLIRIVRMVATTRIACDEGAGRYLFGERAFLTIRNGVDISRYAHRRDYRKELRDKYGIGGEERVILNVGRLAYPKNQGFLIDVFAEYRKENKGAKLFLVGDGEDKEKLKKKIGELELGEVVFLIPANGEAYKFYSMADILIMTSVYEGLPFVAVEAQVNGLPCLFSDGISRGAKLTKGTRFMSLKEPVNSWAKGIAQGLVAGRCDTREYFEDSEYNLENVIKKLGGEYLRLYDRG